jgi:cyclopropane fatty-acyl-phospholipid synthase-like methyltransferase
VHCVGVTISAEQAALGRERCAGLPVEFRLMDYRGLDERFQRIWRYCLLSCAGTFRARDIQLWQWVLAKPGRRGVYPRVTH